MGNAEVIPTLCGMCGRYAICGVNATVKDGKIVKVEGRKTHPLSQGFLCHVGRACLEYQYSPERLTHPMRKTRSGWERLSWGDALQIIVPKLEKCKETYGAESLAVYLGQVMTPMVKHAKRFCDLFGTPNITSAASFCQWSGIIAHILTFGAFAFPDVANSRMMCGACPSGFRSEPTFGWRCVSRWWGRVLQVKAYWRLVCERSITTSSRRHKIIPTYLTCGSGETRRMCWSTWTSLWRPCTREGAWAWAGISAT